MIAYIKGKVLLKKEKFIILETESNIGYKIKISTNLIEKSQENEFLELFIHSHIREDAFDLYGFKNMQELDFFETIISVKGIGPKIGLEIINFDTNKIKKAIIEKDSSVISLIPGIGKKSAERIILELQGKIDIQNLSDLKNNEILENNSEDIIIALTQLGFNRTQVVNGLSKIPKNIKTEEEIITYFLKNKA